MKANVQFDRSEKNTDATLTKLGVAAIYLLGLAIVLLQLRSML